MIWLMVSDARFLGTVLKLNHFQEMLKSCFRFWKPTSTRWAYANTKLFRKKYPDTGWRPKRIKSSSIIWKSWQCAYIFDQPIPKGWEKCWPSWCSGFCLVYWTCFRELGSIGNREAFIRCIPKFLSFPGSRYAQRSSWKKQFQPRQERIKIRFVLLKLLFIRTTRAKSCWNGDPGFLLLTAAPQILSSTLEFLRLKTGWLVIFV